LYVIQEIEDALSDALGEKMDVKLGR